MNAGGTPTTTTSASTKVASTAAADPGFAAQADVDTDTEQACAAANNAGVPLMGGAQAFMRGMRDSLAVMVGYLPMAISFGIAALQAGIAPYMAVLISIMAYTGAGQFVMVALLGSGASAWSIVTSVLLMNIRHLFYGPSLLPRLTVAGRRWPLPLLAAGLTDEVFATAMGNMERVPATQRENWYLGLQLGSYTAWVGGTAVGALLGQQIGQQAQWLQTTLNFVLPALFFALLLELLAHSRWQAVATAMLATGLLLCLLPTHWAMLGGMAAGGLASALQAPVVRMKA